MLQHISVRVLVLGTTLTLALAGCAGNAGTAGSAGGAGDDKLVTLASDLPLQGSNASQSESSNKLIQLYLDQIGSKAGDYTVKLKVYDDATAAKGAWDDSACAKNATDHVANPDEVAVVGTQNSGCTKIQLPVLNQDSTGPMFMISASNTNPGLTKTWDVGEPDKYYPGGTRNFARVVTTDDYQGNAGASFAAKDLKVTKCYVLSDNQTFGIGVSKAFAAAARREGIQIVGQESWDLRQPNYTALFQGVNASGADCVYIGGTYDNNGGQVVKDKVAVLGDNTGVKLIGPDGFTGFPDLLKLPQAKGMYLTFAGLTASQLNANGGGATKKLLDAYQVKYGAPPTGNYPLYGVAATQVALAALAKSDGTRKGLNDQVFSGEGITIPADQSVLGKEIHIDPASGDTTTKDVTIEVVKDQQETYVKSESIA